MCCTSRRPPEPRQVGALVAHLALYLLPLLIFAADRTETDLTGETVQRSGHERPIDMIKREPCTAMEESLQCRLAYAMAAVTKTRAARSLAASDIAKRS